MEDLIAITKNLKVLCAEDDESIRKNLYLVLSEFFDQVDVAVDGQDALNIYNKMFEQTSEYYDIVFTDIMMPNMDGHELIDAIYSQNENQVIVVISAYNETDRFIRLIEQGISNFLKKPLNLDDLVKTITKVSKNIQRIKLVKQQENMIFEQSKLASLGEMIANIAHQWRQPLQAISVITQKLQIIQMVSGKVTQEDIDEMNEQVSNQLQYLTNTIETFRNFLHQDKIATRVNIQEEIKNALELMQTTFKNKSIQAIDTIDHSQPVHATMVSGELTQVIINILNNAKDILLDRSVEKPWVKFDLIRSGETAIITIEDNGGGIDQSILPKIFEPYFTTKHQSRGTGLGLNMSYRIVTESIGGKIYAKNTQNGAKFFVEIPIKN